MAFFKKSKYSTLSALPRQEEPLKRKDIPEGLWEKCKKCDATIFTKQKESNLYICPHCGYHNPMPAPQRIELLTDPGSFVEIDANVESVDTLKFEGVSSYTSKLESNKKKTGLKDAIICGQAKLDAGLMRWV